MLLAGAAIFGGAYWEGYQLRREAATLVREREDIRRQNAQLREEIRLLSTPEYIERLAREQLGLVKPGEIAIILVQPTPAPSPAGGGEAGRRSERWWVRWFRR
jgi:cell division protein FtsL